MPVQKSVPRPIWNLGQRQFDERRGGIPGHVPPNFVHFTSLMRWDQSLWQAIVNVSSDQVERWTCLPHLGRLLHQGQKLIRSLDHDILSVHVITLDWMPEDCRRLYHTNGLCTITPQFQFIIHTSYDDEERFCPFNMVHQRTPQRCRVQCSRKKIPLEIYIF